MVEEIYTSELIKFYNYIGKNDLSEKHRFMAKAVVEKLSILKRFEDSNIPEPELIFHDFSDKPSIYRALLLYKGNEDIKSVNLEKDKGTDFYFNEMGLYVLQGLPGTASSAKKLMEYGYTKWRYKY